jgi:hypothetical protein
MSKDHAGLVEGLIWVEALAGVLPRFVRLCATSGTGDPTRPHVRTLGVGRVDAGGHAPRRGRSTPL